MAGEAGAAHDVLVIGGGGAGLRAAIAVAEADARLSVAVVSKVYPMRSHTVSAEGGAAGVIRPHLDSYWRGTFSLSTSPSSHKAAWTDWRPALTARLWAQIHVRTS